MGVEAEEKEERRRFLILFSTGSGRAKACARRAYRMLQSRNVANVEAPCIFDDKTNLLYPTSTSTRTTKEVWICFVSTTGDGEHNIDCIGHTWNRLLKKNNNDVNLAGVELAMFCLGDRAYGSQFCAAGRKLATRLLQLQATWFCAIGYGDDGTPPNGVFGDCDDWLTHTLLPNFPHNNTTTTSTTTTTTITVPPIAVTPLPSSVVSSGTTEKDGWERYASFLSLLVPNTVYQKEPMSARILHNQRLTPDDWFQETRHVTFEYNNPTNTNNSSSSSYNAGDVALILPFNDATAVQQFANVLPSQLQEMMDVELQIDSNNNNNNKWPSRATLRGLLTYCADIQGIPEREDLYLLSTLATTANQEQQQALFEMSEPSSMLYTQYILQEKRMWHEVLYDFDSISLTLETLLAILPPLRPRQYSIASYHPNDGSTTSHPKQQSTFDLCIAIVSGKTPLGRTYIGQCSRMLSSSSSASLRSTSLPLWIRAGSFPITLPDTPLWLIGAGTGIAPLRSIIQHRQHEQQQQKQQSSSSSCPAVAMTKLLFGCRNPNADYYYHKEWETNYPWLQVVTAFSRILSSSSSSSKQKKKTYVQHLLLSSQEEDVSKFLLHEMGSIYVAGGAKMVQAVKEQILSDLSKVISNPKAFLTKLQRSGRYRQEAWT